MVHRPNVDSWREAAIPDPGACPMAPCPYAPALYRLIRSAGCRARPPSSGRSTRQRWNVKRSRRPPGATRRVSSQLMTSTHHPEHGEAGRGQRLIVHTRQEHPADPLRSHRRGCPPARGFPPSMAGGASGAGAWLQPPAAPEFVSREPEPALMQPHEGPAAG